MLDEKSKPWPALLPCVLAIMAAANLQYTWTLFALPLKEALGAKLSAIQLGFTLYIIAQTWLAPFEGWLADRFAPRPLAVLGGLLVGANWVGAGFSSTLPQLYASCIVGGFGCGLVMAAGGRVALSRFPGRRGLAIGIVSMAYGLGPVLAVAPIQHTIAALGYRRAFIVWGVMQAAAVVGAALFLDGTSSARPAEATHGGGKGPFRMIPTMSFVLMYAIMLLVATGGLLITAQLVPMAGSFGLSKSTLVFGTGAITLAIMIDRLTNSAARPFWGAVSDRLGRSETMALAFICEAAAIGLLATSVGHPLRFVLLSGIAFFAWGEIFSLFPALIADVFGAEFAMTNYGVLFTAKGAAALFAGWGAARLTELNVSWTAILLGCAVCDVLAAALAFFLLKAAILKEKRP
jgi:OFA family oxalate/formate antiporter-like MFS transporter